MKMQSSREHTRCHYYKLFVLWLLWHMAQQAFQAIP
jgi:hypothetical protein